MLYDVSLIAASMARTVVDPSAIRRGSRPPTDAVSGMIRVGVVGAAGRMGQEVCRAIEADPATELACRIDVDDTLDLPVEHRAEVVVDFTVLDVSRQTIRFAAANGIHAVIGTTGFSEDDLEEFRALFTSSNALIAPNFAIGAVLMIRMAELAAPHFETAEVIEFHHNAKIDALSGTATHTAERMAAASSDWAADPTTHEVYPGARGGEGPAGIRVHGVRMAGRSPIKRSFSARPARP